MQDISIIGIIVAVVVLVILLFMAIGYVKAPPDMAYIISGVKKKSKVVIGKASIRIPFFERLDKLNLRLIPIDVKTSNAVPTADYININVDATVNVKISNNPEKLRLAAENFLNKNTEYIAGVAREVLEGNVREIVGKMKLEEMVSDRQKFANLVKENAEPDLAAMGLDIISFNVQNFVDGNEVIENLGIDNIVKIKKAAAIARAESERDIKVAQASADKESNDAAVAEMMIKVLPDIAAKVAEPLGQIDKITIIGGGDGENGVGKVAGNVPVVMAKVFESMKEATGIDLSEIINADSYDAKVNRNVNVTGLDGVNLVVNADTDKNGEKTEN